MVVLISSTLSTLTTDYKAVVNVLRPCHEREQLGDVGDDWHA